MAKVVPAGQDPVSKEVPTVISALAELITTAHPIAAEVAISQAPFELSCEPVKLNLILQFFEI